MIDNHDVLRYQRLEELIRLRNEIYNQIKTYEDSAYFNVWELNDEVHEFYPDLSYSNINTRISELSQIIAQKHYNLVLFSEGYADVKKAYGDVISVIVSKIKKNPKVKEDDLCTIVDKAVLSEALDYMIEKEIIVYKTTKKYGFWKIND